MLPFGAWLSLVEHGLREAGVGGSNPLAPTSVSVSLKLSVFFVIIEIESK